MYRSIVLLFTLAAVGSALQCLQLLCVQPLENCKPEKSLPCNNICSHHAVNISVLINVANPGHAKLMSNAYEMRVKSYNNLQKDTSNHITMDDLVSHEFTCVTKDKCTDSKFHCCSVDNCNNGRINDGKKYRNGKGKKLAAPSEEQNTPSYSINKEGNKNQGHDNKRGSAVVAKISLVASVCCLLMSMIL